ncbi:MAG: alpha-E domain-containing protein [Paludibacter sp.]|nr:alpha-E domain-containing protein [Paludibacter sp.]
MELNALKKMNKGISTAKANRLYWLGRYAERVYLALHLLRKHYDLMIDEDSYAYNDFCYKMGVQNRYVSGEQFITSYLYDTDNPDSIINMLEKVKDNAILLREEIMSETLSYIQMSIFFMKAAKVEGRILSELQTITDFMLAFWGSIDERINNSEIRTIIKFGKFVESSDLHLRFGYPLDRIESINVRLFEALDNNTELCDEINLLAYKNNMVADKYNEPRTLYYLNGLFSA